MTSLYFPDAEMITQDLITEILVRLPVKYLLRCKAVSKPWLSLISSPIFIDSQLRHAVSKPGADRTLMVYKSADNSTCSLNLDAPEIEVPLGFPFSRGDYSFQPGYKIIGALNGIVCVSVTNCPPSRDFSWYNDRHYHNNPSIYLWNPATKHSKLIPPHYIRGDIMAIVLGFGFDPVDDDYKVLRVVSSFDKPFSAEVYSANADVWQKLDPRPTDYPDYDDIDVCVNGFLCCEGLYGLMALDLNTDVIACGIRLPARSFNSCITDYNDSLAIITSKRGEELNCGFNLWTLDDEACLRGGGVEASWTLMLTINLDIIIDCIPPRVYGCFNNGDFLSCAGVGVCLLYNSHNKETRNVSSSIIVGRRIIKYNESLVSITGSKQIDENAHEDDS